MKFYFLVQAQENEFRLFNELMYSDVKYRNVKRANFEAAFTGICSDGGIVTLNWMSLDNTHNDFTRINVTSQVNPITGEREVDPLEVARNSEVLEGTTILDFIIASEVQINYHKVSPEDSVSIFAGITNFIFHGNNVHTSRRPKRHHLRNALIISIDDIDFEFVNLPKYSTFIELQNYDNFMKQLKLKQSDVTCECIAIQKYANIPITRNKLYKILYILSFATCNWLTTLYENTYRDMKLIRTILLPYKTFPFIGGQYAINPTSTVNNPLKRLVEIGYDEYSRLEDLIGLKYLIEDYIMSPREGNLEAQYVMLAIAMETLASYASSLARRNSTVIPNKTRKEKTTRILNVSKKLKVTIPDQLIEEIEKVGGYYDVRLRDKLNYVFASQGISPSPYLSLSLICLIFNRVSSCGRAFKSHSNERIALFLL